MGRSKGKSWSDAPKAAVARRKGLAATVADDFVVSDSDEERNDVSNRRPDKISLNKADDFQDDSDDGMNEEEVMGLSEDEEDEDEDDELEEDDDEDDDEQAMIEKMIARGGRSAELAKQAKMIGAKLKLQQKEHDEEDDEEEDDQQEGGWGANKKRYYDADTAGLEGSDAEEALQEEEEEVARLEQLKAGRMRSSDFGLDDDEEEEEGESEEDDEGEEDGEETMAALAKLKKAKGGKAVQRGVEVEAVAKQLDALTAEERGSALMADAPELLVLLQDLTESLTEVRQRVGPVLQEVRSGGLATSEGISYLEAKYLLLLQYCSHIVFYILLKAEGRPVKDHPVIARLVELRAYLEKIRPIDKRLQYQIERLIKAAQIAAKEQQPAARGGAAAEPATAAAAAAAAGGEDLQAADIDADALHFGPRRDQLAGPANGAAAAGASKAAAAPSGVYRPPKINPVSMEGDADRRVLSRDESRLLKEARRKASRSELVRELAEDVAGAPRELRTEVPGFDSLAAVKQRQRLEARAAVEEDMMSRVPLSKEEAKKMRQQQRAGMSGKSMLDDFSDEVADIVGMSQGPDGGKGSRLADLFSRQKVSQKFGAEPARLAAHGGDEDLPRREALHERRSKFDAVAARRSAAAADGFDDDDGDGPDSEFFGGGGRGGKAGKRRGGEEDDLYQEAKASAQERKRARQDKFASPAMHPPLPDEPAAGARGITTAIEKNRGLTPHRRKDLKNPRKKHRLMFEKATMRHKGAVQGVRSPTATYGGEATGLKSRVVKSRKIG